jgi:hypothetical protein
MQISLFWAPYADGIMLSVVYWFYYANCHYAECLSHDCLYAQYLGSECLYDVFLLLSVIIPSVIMLSAILLRFLC